jgi:hypothetical protein
LTNRKVLKKSESPGIKEEVKSSSFYYFRTQQLGFSSSYFVEAVRRALYTLHNFEISPVASKLDDRRFPVCCSCYVIEHRLASFQVKPVSVGEDVQLGAANR